MSIDSKGEATNTSFITGTTSLYLDALRFIAALLVVFSHAAEASLWTGPAALARFGHEAVIIFFVLSGLVIASVVQRPGESLRTYALARVSRIYSVALPALLLSLLAAITVIILDPTNEEVGARMSWRNFFWGGLFLNQVWGMSVVPTNAAWWSLSHEVWFYLIFGLLVFLPRRMNLIAAGLATLAAGPLIVLLAPVWFAGVWLFNDQRLRIRSSGIGAVVFGLSLLGLLAVEFSGLTARTFEILATHMARVRDLDHSKNFLIDYVLAVLIVLNFMGFEAFSRHLQPKPWLAASVRLLAGFTFSLYLFHQPLLAVARASGIHARYNPVEATFIVGTVICASFVLSLFTERQRRFFHRTLTQIVEFLPYIRGVDGSSRTSQLRL